LSAAGELFIIRTMIPTKHFSHLFVWLTLILLVACEPLAPDQTPRYIVVTGETPQDIAWVSTSTPDVATPTPTSPPATPTVTAVPVPSPAPFVCTQTEGQIVRLSFYSRIIGDEVPFRMYQPPCFYETFQRYPYVVLLHGTGYDEAMWEDIGVASILDAGIANGTLPPMVLIMPDGGELAEYNDLPDGESYESVLMDELLPMVERDFCLLSNREGRAIGGISRGGFWAFSIGLRHPDFFGAIGRHSPYFENGNALPEYNPLDLVQRVNATKFPQRIYLDHAANDIVGTNVSQLSSLLRERGIAHEYLIDPVGDHDMAYWQAHAAGYLQFYGETWPHDVMALPSCLAPSPE